MGLFDTIHFKKAKTCKICGGPIGSIQVKDFNQTLSHYYEKDCISHQEDTRIIKEEVFCNQCHKFVDQNIYIAVVRGIVIGSTDSYAEAERMLQELNLEKLIFWYHALYKRYRASERRFAGMRRFLRDLVEWYEEGPQRDEKTGQVRPSLAFLRGKKFLENEQNPLEAIKKYLADKCNRDAKERNNEMT